MIKWKFLLIILSIALLTANNFLLWKAFHSLDEYTANIIEILFEEIDEIKRRTN